MNSRLLEYHPSIQSKKLERIKKKSVGQRSKQLFRSTDNSVVDTRSL